MLPTMASSSVAPRERRRNVRLAIVIAVIALAVYAILWLKAVL
jgi:hypothetical protein